MAKAKTESTNPPTAVHPETLDTDDPNFELALRYYAFLDQERNQLARVLPAYRYVADHPVSVEINRWLAAASPVTRARAVLLAVAMISA